MKNKKRKIGVGSQNPVKIRAAEEAFNKIWPEVDWEVLSFSVESDVSDQPMTKTETVNGARNRAAKVLKEDSLDFAVGIEGGLYEFDGEYYDSTWVVVMDKEGREGVGSTISIKMPDKIMTKIHSGQELGDVIDEVFNGTNLSKKQGYFGLMTKGLVDRTNGYVDGVISALSRFIHKDLF